MEVNQLSSLAVVQINTRLDLTAGRASSVVISHVEISGVADACDTSHIVPDYSWVVVNLHRNPRVSLDDHTVEFVIRVRILVNYLTRESTVFELYHQTI